jgi:type IX secretion system PorP/SprF family membrane protein
MKKYYLLIIGIWMSGMMFGQQLNISSLYNLNKYEINPAVAGSEEGMPTAFSFRKSWIGIDGAPTTQRLSTHLGVGKSMGVGLQVINNVQGPLRRTGMEATYAYHISLNATDSSYLSFGLSAFLYQYYLNKQSFVVEDPSDPVIQGSEKKLVPDAAFGVYYHARDYYIGLAVYQLFQGRIEYDASDIADNKRIRHYFMNMGYNFRIGKDFELEPSVLLKYLEGSVFQADVNVYATYMKMISLGVSYRTSNAIILQLGYQTGALNIGYAYDIGLSDITTVSGGSHEIMVIYRFGNFLR